MSPEEVEEILFTMTAIWTQKINDPTLMVWKELLAPEDRSKVRAAIKQLADTSKYFPAWSEVKEIVELLKRQEREAPKAIEAGSYLSHEENLERLKEIKKLRSM
jgi:hypothetical protein